MLGADLNERRLIGLAPAAGVATLIATAGVLPALCPFRLCTGMACPLCGMTRAARSLFTGDVGTAFRFQPLAVVVVLEAIVIALVVVRTGTRPSQRSMLVLVAVNVVGAALVWIARWRLGLLAFVLE